VPSKRLRVDDLAPSSSGLLPASYEAQPHQQIALPSLNSDSTEDQQIGGERSAAPLTSSHEETGQIHKVQNGITNGHDARANLNHSLGNGHDSEADKQQVPDYLQLPQQGVGAMANFHPIYFEDAAYVNAQFDHAIQNLPTTIYSTVGSQMDQRNEADPYGFTQSPLTGPRIRPLSRIGFVVPGTPQYRPPSVFRNSPQNQPQTAQGCRYLVVVPILQHINSVIPASIACDLLDFYFAEPSSSLFESASPYVLTHIFRKKSFLHPTQPRTTSPALLVAMLWATAQTSDAQIFKTSPTSRGRICDRLFAICLRLLNPLIHESPRTVPGKSLCRVFDLY
jgi:hypothetical protein